MDGWVDVPFLPGEYVAPEGTMGRIQADIGNRMLWVMLSWESLDPSMTVLLTLVRPVLVLFQIVLPYNYSD